MRRLREASAWGLAIAVGLAAAGCAHAPAARRPLPDVTWPAPPEAPRVRLAALLPDLDAPPPPRSFWRRVWDAITGVDPVRARAALLERPFGVAIAADGAVLVADPDVPSVVRFGADGSEARVTCRSRDWRAPMALARGAGGELVVADAGAGELVFVAPDGHCRAIGNGVLERPTGVAVSGERLLVADPPRHVVLALSSTGEVLQRWGGHGEGVGEFNFPTSVAMAPDGSFLVVDALNFRIVRISADGRWLGAFGSAGDSGAAFSRPKAVTTDADGRVYVSDAQRDVVLVFGAGGAFEYAVGASGTAPGHFTLPAGIAVGGGRMYVADSHNRRVQVFQFVGGAS